MTASWPKTLVPASGPMRRDKLDGAAQGMGRWGQETRALAAEGFIPPDMITGLTLFLLSSQRREPSAQQGIPGGGGGVAGGVWVRERFTIHCPLRREEAFTARGEAVGRHVHKGRRYGTNRCVTKNAEGVLAASNLTTGLLAYKVDPGLNDALEGQSPEAVTAPAPDWGVASHNPALDQLRRFKSGQAFTGDPVCLSLDLMVARDTDKPDNPIHSDPELAQKAGLAQPIAGGSHVLAFALEVLLQQTGRHALFHGACFDIRWKAPVFAEATIVPEVHVASASTDQVTFTLQVSLEDGVTAMTGTVTVPLV